MITADSNVSLDFSGTGGNNWTTLRFGAATPGYVYSGTITPNTTDSTIRLGGGGTLFVSSALSGASTAVNVGLNGLTTGEVFLTNTSNTFGGGGLTIESNNLAVKGDGRSADPARDVQHCTPTLTFLSSGANTLTHNVVMTSAGTISNGGQGFSLSGTNFSGSSALTLAGKGPSHSRLRRPTQHPSRSMPFDDDTNRTNLFGTGISYWAWVTMSTLRPVGPFPQVSPIALLVRSLTTRAISYWSERMPSRRDAHIGRYRRIIRPWYPRIARHRPG